MPSPFASLHVAVTHPASSARPTLRSLRAQTGEGFQVVLVDNASQENALPWQHGEGPELMALRNFRDQGFVRAHNQALTSIFARWPQEALGTRWIGILSGRVMLAPDCLTQLFQAINAHPEVTVVSPKVRSAHLQSQDDRDDPQLVDTGMIEEAGRVFSKTLELVARGRGERDEGQYDQSAAGVLPGTWCLLVRADALMRAKVGDGWLDVDLPEPYAVADLVWRLQTLGEPTLYVPQALAWVQRPLEPSRGWVKRVRRWYGQEASRERAARSYACLLRMKQAPWQKIISAFPWLVGSWLMRCLEVCLDPRILPTVLYSWLLLPRAIRARSVLRLAAMTRK